MSSLKKIKYSFVLCLALLFSFSFAGTLTYNSDDYSIPFLQYDIEIAGDVNYSLIYSEDYLGNPEYRLTVYNSSYLDNIEVYGSDYIWDYDNTPIYQLFHLKPNGDTYIRSTPKQMVFTIYSDGSIWGSFDGGTFRLNSSDFPLLCNDYSWTVTNYNILEYYSTFTVLYSSFDIYTVSLNNGSYILVDQIYGGSSSPSIPSFTTTLSQQDVNNNILGLFNTQTFFDNLPDNYTNYFVQYNENTHEYLYYFMPSYICPAGVVYLDNEDNPDYYQFYFYQVNKPLLNLFTTDYVYVFSSYNGLYYLKDTFVAYSYEFSRNATNFDYSNFPIIYSIPSMPFYVIENGIPVENASFSVNSFNILNSNNEVVTASDILSEPKSDNSIWSMLYNIFNPKTDNSDVVSVENQHNEIISKSDNAGFFQMFEDSKSLIVSLTSITWLTTAITSMFSIFKDFIILCCVFLTISRVMGG